MEKFFEKYIDEFDENDALKLIDKHVSKAKHLCEKEKMEYLSCLATAYDMIGDYFADKGIDVKTYKRT